MQENTEFARIWGEVRAEATADGGRLHAQHLRELARDGHGLRRALHGRGGALRRAARGNMWAAGLTSGCGRGERGGGEAGVRGLLPATARSRTPWPARPWTTRDSAASRACWRTHAGLGRHLAGCGHRADRLRRVAGGAEVQHPAAGAVRPGGRRPGEHRRPGADSRAVQGLATSGTRTYSCCPCSPACARRAARSLLEYRYNTLGDAVESARRFSAKGARILLDVGRHRL